MLPEVAAAKRGLESATHEPEPFLSVEHARLYFKLASGIPFKPARRVHAVDDVSLFLQRGRTLGIAGETGSGKSTLARCILRLYELDGGKITFKGVDITRLRGEKLRRIRANMQPIFQDPYSSLNPRATVREIVAEPLFAHGHHRHDINSRVDESLRLAGLSPRLAVRFPHEFSGGQRQRISIARAIALTPELIVADEPLSALDVSIQAQIINLMLDLQDRLALTYILISHDLRVIRHISTDVAIMFLGKIVEYGRANEVCSIPRHPYTYALLSAVPEMRRQHTIEPALLAGDPPSPTEPPSGCRFRTRCPRAQAICAEVEPPLEELDPGRRVACHFPLSPGESLQAKEQR